MKEKIILCCSGGGLYGVFGAGILTKFNDLGVHNNIEAVYGASAGAINAAYFLSGQVKLGSSIYSENLTKGFLHIWRIPLGIVELFWYKYVLGRLMPKNKIRKILDIDYLMNILKNKKRLDIEKIKKKKIKFYVALLNTKSWKIDYVDVKKENSPDVLKASASIMPYYFPLTKIKEKKYTDVGIKQPIGLKEIMKRHPQNKIVLLFNCPFKRIPWFYWKNFIEGAVCTAQNVPLKKTFLEREDSVRRDLELALKSERVLLFYPPKNNPLVPWSTSKEKLKKSYEIGYKEGDKIKEFLKL